MTVLAPFIFKIPDAALCVGLQAQRTQRPPPLLVRKEGAHREKAHVLAPVYKGLNLWGCVRNSANCSVRLCASIRGGFKALPQAIQAI